MCQVLDGKRQYQPMNPCPYGMMTFRVEDYYPVKQQHQTESWNVNRSYFSSWINYFYWLSRFSERRSRVWKNQSWGREREIGNHCSLQKCLVQQKQTGWEAWSQQFLVNILGVAVQGIKALAIFPLISQIKCREQNRMDITKQSGVFANWDECWQI